MSVLLPTRLVELMGTGGAPVIVNIHDDVLIPGLLQVELDGPWYEWQVTVEDHRELYFGRRSVRVRTADFNGNLYEGQTYPRQLAVSPDGLSAILVLRGNGELEGFRP